MKTSDANAQRSAQEVPDTPLDPLQPWILELYSAALETPVAEFPAWARAMMRSLPLSVSAAEFSLLTAHQHEATRVNARLHREYRADAHILIGRALVDPGRRLVHWTEQFVALAAGKSYVLREGVVPRSWLRATKCSGPAANVELRARRIGTHWSLRAAQLQGCEQLTLRERAIARAFGEGRSYREVAVEMGLTPAAVRNGLQRTYTKLGISSKAELVALAFLADA